MEFWSSFTKWFNEKTSSPLYFTYIGFFIVWNWKFFQIIFLESASLFNNPRIEYIYSELLFSITFPKNTPIWASVPIDWIMNFAIHIIPPILFTYLAIKFFPILHKWALNEYLESRFERKRMFDEKQREHNEWLLKQEKKETTTLENILSVREKKIKTEKEIKKTMSDEDIWTIEYQDFEKNASFYKFKQIIESVYSKGGVIESNYERNIEAGSLAMADAWGLINYVDPNVIDLTKKGKIFARMYLKTNTI